MAFKGQSRNLTRLRTRRGHPNRHVEELQEVWPAEPILNTADLNLRDLRWMDWHTDPPGLHQSSKDPAKLRNIKAISNIKAWRGPGLTPLCYSENSPKGKSGMRTLAWPLQKCSWKLSSSFCQLCVLDLPICPRDVHCLTGPVEPQPQTQVSVCAVRRLQKEQTLPLTAEWGLGWEIYTLYSFLPEAP